jgi:DNA-binding CsgD family transcriptional regulator
MAAKTEGGKVRPRACLSVLSCHLFVREILRSAANWRREQRLMGVPPARSEGNVTAECDIVGRTQELAELQGIVQRFANEGGALLLFGDVGVGKSVLLDAMAKLALATDVRVVRARGVQFEADMPYAGLHQTLLPLYSEFGHLSEAQRAPLEVALGFGIGPPPDKLVVANATLSLVSAIGTQSPLLIIVDDLPWLDRASATVFGFVARRLNGTRVGLIAASRTGEESFFTRSGLPEIGVEPLKDGAARDLMERRFSAIVPPMRERVLLEAQGNPLAIVELCAAIEQHRSDTTADFSLLVPVSQRLQDLFTSRIQALSPQTRDLLLIMALDGTGGLPVTAVTRSWLNHLPEAERARLAYLDPGTQRPVFRHPLIRSTVVGMAPGQDQQRAHRVLADIWSDQPERHAWHLYQATNEPDEAVAALLERAALQALGRGDGVGAVSNLTRAAELSVSPTERSRRLGGAAHIGADATGELSNATKLLAAARDADPDFTETLQAAATAAYVLMNTDGDIDTAHRLLVTAIGSDAPASVAALEEALAALALVCYFGARADLWEDFHDALDRLQPDVPSTLMVLGDCFADPARAPAEAIAKLEVAIARLTTETDPSVILKTGFAARNCDRLASGRPAFRRVEREARTSGAIGWRIQALTLLAWDDWWSGRWVSAIRLCDDALALCKDHGFPLFAHSTNHVKAAVFSARGEFHNAEPILDEMIQWGKPRGVGLVDMMSSHVCVIDALGRGDYEAAYGFATEICPAGTLASHATFAPWVMMDVVESAMRTGRVAEAHAHLAVIEQTGLASISPRFALLAAGSAAMAAPSDEATWLFEQAISIPDVDRWPLLLARVQLAYGEHLRRRRATKDAREQLSAALHSLESLGATLFAQRAAIELRATGQTRVSVSDRDPCALTPQEHEIAMLAASGLSNKEIGQRLVLSPRTVGAHLYRVFPKLGVNSRAALRDALDSIPQEAPLSVRIL